MATDTQYRYFPYEKIRPQQKQIMHFVRNCLQQQEVGIFEAATGIGKTIAVLSELVKYLSEFDEEENKRKIIFCGRTHSQADRVIEELLEINSNNTITGASKRGRRALCINKEIKAKFHGRSFNVLCEHAKKHKSCRYFVNSLDKRKYELAQDLIALPVQSSHIIEESEYNDMCPSEVSNVIIKSVDVIACSYNYIFNPKIRSRFLQGLQLELEDLIIVIDECHNLPEQVADMNTFEITENFVKQSTTELNRLRQEDEKNKKTLFKHLVRGIEQVVKQSEGERVIRSLDLIKEIEKEMILLGSNTMVDKEVCQDLMQTGRDLMYNSVSMNYSYLEVLGEALIFLFEIMGTPDELIIINPNTQRIKMSIIDPSNLIAPILKTSHSAILMSGTLGSPRIYLSQTGLWGSNVLQFPSPYKQELEVYVVKGLSTKYSRRSKKMFEKYAMVIGKICQEKVNIGLYVPSYDILDKIFESGLNRVNKPVLRATSGMSSYKTEKMIEEFRTYKKKGGALLCSVMRGRSSEGVDFPGDDMRIIIIVGIPYPPKSIEVDSKLEYYKQRTKAAWNIVLSEPAFRHINQTGGRAVRSLEDKAKIFLLDDRIANKTYKLTSWMREAVKILSVNEI